MDLKVLFKTAHHIVEANERQDISQKVMAKRLGISARSYAEYLSGGSAPIAAKATIRMLALLPDEEILKLVRACDKDTHK